MVVTVITIESDGCHNHHERNHRLGAGRDRVLSEHVGDYILEGNRP
jgi:hypothetical protein